MDTLLRTGREILTAVMAELRKRPDARTLDIPGGAREIHGQGEYSDCPTPEDTYIFYDAFLCVPGVDGHVWLLSLGEERSNNNEPTGYGSLTLARFTPAAEASDELLLAYGIRELTSYGTHPTLLFYTPQDEITWDGEGEHAWQDESASFANALFAKYEQKVEGGAFRYQLDAIPLIVDGLISIIHEETD